MDSNHDLDTVLDVCNHKHRRIVLATLEDRQQPVSIGDLTDAIIEHNHHLTPNEADAETLKRIHVGLHQAHLPRLVEAGLIQYDRERGVVESPAQASRADPYLSTILAMDAELPTTTTSSQ